MKKGHYYLATYWAAGSYPVLFKLKDIRRDGAERVDSKYILADILFDADISSANWTGRKNQRIIIENEKEIPKDMLLIEKCKLEMKKNGRK
jgi:hypothetical protein